MIVKGELAELAADVKVLLDHAVEERLVPGLVGLE